jgi:hypothetical protein
MTLHKDKDPGWWRRPMTNRATVIVVTVAILVIVGVGIYMAVNGIPLF